MTITADAVKQLRERTGAGMMECKRALVETSGDLDAAADLMRKQGLAKADKKATRIPAGSTCMFLKIVIGPLALVPSSVGVCWATAVPPARAAIAAAAVMTLNVRMRSMYPRERDCYRTA